jgi:hypothetical protein
MAAERRLSGPAALMLSVKTSSWQTPCLLESDFRTAKYHPPLCCATLFFCPAGGVAPAAGTGLAEPPGGGVGQMVKDTLLTPTGGNVCAKPCCAWGVKMHPYWASMWLSQCVVVAVQLGACHDCSAHYVQSSWCCRKPGRLPSSSASLSLALQRHCLPSRVTPSWYHQPIASSCLPHPTRRRW